MIRHRKYAARYYLFRIDCGFLGRLYNVVVIVCNDEIPRTFNTGVLATIGCFMFIFSANYGEINSLCEKKLEGYKEYSTIALTAPLLLAAEAVCILVFSMFYFTTSVTPITEKFTKAIPVFIFALAYSDKFDDLMMNGFFVGIGFAVLENLVILTQDFSSVTLVWAVIRGFASGLMHGICTGLVSICISFVRNKKKLFYCGLFATFNLAVVYHSIFNSLVQSSSKPLNYIGIALPML